MIGVLCSPEERTAVAEFFELFKTPWGFYEDGRNYEVLIVTAATESVRLDASVIVAFGSRGAWIDDEFALETGPRHAVRGRELRAASIEVPLDGCLLTLA